MERLSEEANASTAVTAAPGLKVQQWNVQGLRLMRHQVLQSIFQDGLGVVFLQKILTPADFQCSVADFTLHSLPVTEEGSQGYLALVRSWKKSLN